MEAVEPSACTNLPRRAASVPERVAVAHIASDLARVVVSLARSAPARPAAEQDKIPVCGGVRPSELGSEPDPLRWSRRLHPTPGVHTARVVLVSGSPRTWLTPRMPRTISGSQAGFQFQTADSIYRNIIVEITHADE